jgi:hypothetical protein
MNTLRKIIREGIEDALFEIKIKKQNLLIRETIKDVFLPTKLGSNTQFINESSNLLINNNLEGFYSYIFETAEMEAALLDICVLTFSTENTKLGGSVVTFSLPAGWSCPFASACMKKVDRERKVDPKKIGTSKISKRTGEDVPYKGDVVVTKGKDAEYDCFAANQEMQYDALRANRWHNYDLLLAAGKEGGAEAQADLIIRSLEYFFDTEGEKNEVRIHESGDFYNGEYLKAWMITAKKMPNINFYAYTKSIPYVQSMEQQLKDIPNFTITLSQGGRKDADIANVDIKTARVFNTPEEILKAGLILDLDDNLAKERGGREKDFALLVHGTQGAGEMSKNKMRNETFMAYWKYRGQLNRSVGKPSDYRLTTSEAKEGLEIIDNALKTPSKKVNVTNLKFIKKLLNYVVKYNNYRFSDELINILPKKYRP